MSTTATRVTTITYSGAVTGVQTISAASNAASPGSTQIINLASGANTINAPTGGSTPVSLTIQPPVGNVVTLTLKGVTGDTGIPLHLTDSCTVSLAASFSSLCLTAGNTVTGVVLYWT